jgi:hypothetical protein
MPRFLLASLPLLVLACGSVGSDVVFPAAYFSSRDNVPPPVPSCAAPVQVRVTDARPTPSVVGRRFEDDKPTVSYPIKMQGDAAAYVHSGVEKALQAGGGAPVGKTPASLVITITQIAMEEKKVHLADFTAQLGLDASLIPATSSQTCWSGRVSGSGRNHGKAGNQKNYQETLNQALDEATAQLLKAPGFADALCGKCSS